MTSWLTVKESAECVQTDEEDSDTEQSQELGVFKLRSTYTRGLNALHCSGASQDASWCESKSCFEEIIYLANDSHTTEESAAARSESELIVFLAYSNLSRMLAKCNDKKDALRYALSAASVLSIRECNKKDPGLLLRIAKIALEVGDLWSCKHLIGYRMSIEEDMQGNGGGLLDSFHQLSDDLNEKISEQSSVFSTDNFEEDRKVLLLEIDRPSTPTHFPTSTSNSISTFDHDSSSKAFSKLSSLLDCQELVENLDYTFQLRFRPPSTLSSSTTSFHHSSSGSASAAAVDVPHNTTLHATATATLLPSDLRIHSESTTARTDSNQQPKDSDLILSTTTHDNTESIKAHTAASDASDISCQYTETNTEFKIQNEVLDLTSDTNSNSIPSSVVVPIITRTVEPRKGRSGTAELKQNSEIGIVSGRRKKEISCTVSSISSKFNIVQVS